MYVTITLAEAAHSPSDVPQQYAHPLTDPTQAVFTILVLRHRDNCDSYMALGKLRPNNAVYAHAGLV
jgi:hypothetical protein